MIRAVIIDLDDTLCLTEAVCFEMENKVLKIVGRKPMSRDIHLSTWGKPLFEAIKIRSPGIDVEAFKTAYHPLIKEYIKEGKLDSIPEVNYKALDKLNQLGKILMVLTSRTHVELQHLLEDDHKLAPRIKAFYYRDNMAYHKPDPRAFSELLKNSDLLPNQCVYVGDSISDAQAARDAGLHFVASLESGLKQREDFKNMSVDVFVNKFPDVVDAVTSLDSSIISS